MGKDMNEAMRANRRTADQREHEARIKQAQESARYQAELQRARAEILDSREADLRYRRKTALRWMGVRAVLVGVLMVVCWLAETKNMIDPVMMTWISCVGYAYLAFWVGGLVQLYREEI